MRAGRRISALLALAATLPLPVAAQEGDVRALFPQRAPVSIDEVRGLQRLELPVEVLSACRIDLSDLRLVAEPDGDDLGGDDSEGAQPRQVPFLVDDDRVRPQSGALQLRTRVEPEILDLFREPRGEEEDRRHIERITLRMPLETTGEDSPAWDLVFATPRSRFARRVSVTAIGDDGLRRRLVEGESIFRLPEADAEKLRIRFGRVSEPRLEVEIEGLEGSYLEPTLRLESHRDLRSSAETRIRLTEIERRSEGGRTRLVVERPAGVRPGAIAITTATRLFQREVAVRDGGRLGGDRTLGSSTLFRLRDGDLEGAPILERLRVDVAPSQGDRLEIVITDGDSPALAELAVFALLLQPSLLFDADDLPAGRSGLALYFGGGRAHRPRYDLAGLLETPLPDPDRVAAAARLLDQATTAELGAIESNPLFDRSPPLEFAMRPGAEVDRRPYSHHRRVRALPSEQGLHRLDLDAADLAITRSDVADVRVVDADSRQWAYLVGEEEEAPATELASSRVTEDGRSRYRIVLPAAGAPIAGLLIDSPSPFFDRGFSLEARLASGGSDRSAIARGRLARDARQSASGDGREAVEIAFSRARVTELELVVEDGDDGPLELSIRGRFLRRPLYFVAPEGEYQLLLGHPDDDPPVYELRRVRNLVLALEASAAELGPLEPNPDFRRAARAGTVRGAQSLLLWTAVLVAVAALSWLTLRLARSEPDS